MNEQVPDHIEKQITLRAPRTRVWRAITDAQEFGTWFGVRLDGEFRAGQRLTGVITPTQVDPEVARMQEPHAGTRFDLVVDRIEPEHHFSFRWHPYALEPGATYEHEPFTTVTFELEEVPGGTHLTVRESGFSALPPERRAEAFQANEGGWELQARLIEKYLLQGER